MAQGWTGPYKLKKHFKGDAMPQRAVPADDFLKPKGLSQRVKKWRGMHLSPLCVNFNELAGVQKMKKTIIDSRFVNKYRELIDLNSHGGGV